MSAGRGLMSAVIRIRPDLDALRKDLKEEIPEAVRDAAREAEREAARGFKRVGDEAGDRMEKGIEDGVGDGLRKGADGRWRNAKGQYAKVGDQAGKEIGKGIEKGVDDAARRAGTSLSQKLSDVSGKALKTGAVMSAGLTLPAVMLAKSAAQAAMDHEDNIGAVEQMYQEGTARINKWLESSASKFQLSQTTGMSGVMALSGYMTGMHGETDKAADEATKIMERLADATAFYGGKIEDKVAAFASAMNGSFEPLETQFAGAAMRMSEVAEHAAKMGLLTVDATALEAANIAVAKAEERVTKLRKEGKTGTVEFTDATNKLTQAKEKADEVSKGAADSLSQEARWLATVDLFLQKTAKSEGAIARERDTATGSVREATMAWEDMKLELGQQLLPIITELAPKFADLFERMADDGVFDRLIPAIEKLAEVGATLLEFFTDLPSEVQSAVIGLAVFGGPALTMVGTVGKLISQLWKLAGAFRGAGAAAAAANAAGGMGGVGGAGGLAGRAGLAGRIGLGAAGVGMLYQGFATGDKKPSNWQLIGGTTATGAAIGGPTGAAIGAAIGVGGAVGNYINDRTGFADHIADWLGFDDGGVHPGRRGVHTPAMVAGGELMVPTHKMPLPDALRSVGVDVGAGTDNALLARIAAGVEAVLAAPRTVTVVAPAGMDLNRLADALDELSRTGASRRLKPAANRI